MNSVVESVGARLPLSLNVELLKHNDDDSRDFEVALQVAGAPETRILAAVKEPAGRTPVLLRIDSDGIGVLPSDLRGNLVMLAFRLLYHEMVDAGGDEIEWHMNDASDWLLRHFGLAEGNQIITVMLPHARPCKPFKSWNAVRVG